MSTMLVYGIHCAPADLPALPASEARADYYLDYGLLIFPNYTRATCVQSHGRLSKRFWDEVQRVVGSPRRPHEVDAEQPYITDDEDEVVRSLREAYPTIQPAWYYVPRVVWTSPDDMPAIQVSDLS